MDTHSSPNAHERVLDDRDLDYWGMFLDLIPPVLRAWKLFVVATIAAGAIAYYFGASQTYSSISYIGPFDGPKARYVESIIRSEPVLQAVLDKFPDYPQQGMLDSRRHMYLGEHIRFYPAAGSDPKQESLYILEISDRNPSKVQELLSNLIEAFLPATKPQPGVAARLERLLEVTRTQASDLSSVLNELLKHPEQILPRPGYFPPNVADIIRLRSESVTRAESLKSELEGMSKDVILSQPAVPSMSAKSDRIKIVVEAMGATFVVLLVIVALRHVLVASMSSPLYGARMQRIRDALPWRTARTDVL